MIQWQDHEHRQAVLMLLSTGVLRPRAAIRPLIEHLLSINWLSYTSRKTEFALEPVGRQALERLANEHWPEWRHALEWLTVRELPITAVNLVSYVRAQAFPGFAPAELPARVNRKTLAAMFARHSKVALTDKIHVEYPDAVITQDSTVEIYPNAGLQIIQGSKRVDAMQVAQVLGVVAITERARLDGGSFSGTLPELIVTVENLAAFVDLPKAANTAYIFNEGWNYEPVAAVIRLFPDSIPWVHFGDFDPDGWAIASELGKATGRALTYFVPDCLEDYIQTHRQSLSATDEWPALAGEQHPLLAQLSGNRAWIEQECMVLDQRVHAALASFARLNQA